MADKASLAGAARTLGLSSATVAEQVQALERELGVRLVKRHGRAVTLTDEGIAVVAAGRDILARVADLAQVAQLGRLRGSLRVGSVSTALVSIVPPTLRFMARQYPEVSLNIVPGTSAQLFGMVETREIDCAITVRPRFALAKGLGWQLLRDEKLTLVTPLGLDVADVRECMASRPLIRMYRNSLTGQIISAYLEANDLAPRELFEIEAAEVILMLVSQGLGIALLPDYGFHSSEDRPLRKTVIDGRAYARPVGILYRHGGGRGPADA